MDLVQGHARQPGRAREGDTGLQQLGVVGEGGGPLDRPLLGRRVVDALRRSVLTRERAGHRLHRPRTRRRIRHHDLLEILDAAVVLNGELEIRRTHALGVQVLPRQLDGIGVGVVARRILLDDVDVRVGISLVAAAAALLADRGGAVLPSVDDHRVIRLVDGDAAGAQGVPVDYVDAASVVEGGRGDDDAFVQKAGTVHGIRIRDGCTIGLLLHVEGAGRPDSPFAVSPFGHVGVLALDAPPPDEGIVSDPGVDDLVGGLAGEEDAPVDGVGAVLHVRGDLPAVLPRAGWLGGFRIDSARSGQVDRNGFAVDLDGRRLLPGGFLHVEGEVDVAADLVQPVGLVVEHALHGGAVRRDIARRVLEGEFSDDAPKRLGKADGEAHAFLRRRRSLPIEGQPGRVIDLHGLVLTGRNKLAAGIPDRLNDGQLSQLEIAARLDRAGSDVSCLGGRPPDGGCAQAQSDRHEHTQRTAHWPHEFVHLVVCLSNSGRRVSCEER